MPQDLNFIDDARAKGLSDAEITELLKGQGWSDIQIKAGLLGLQAPQAQPEVPATAFTPQVVSDAQLMPAKPASKQIHPLEAALQHILLWAFTSISTTAFIAVAFAYYSGIETKWLAVFTVTELVFFLPFAAIYFKYLRNLRRDAELKTGHVWSIITIVLHAIGLLGALAGMVIAGFTSEGSTLKALLLGVGAVAVMNAATVISYCVANFTKPKRAGRTVLIAVLPIVFLALILSLTLAGVSKAGDSDQDARTKQHLADATTSVRNYIEANNRLPANLADASYTDSTISYRVLPQKASTYETNLRYELCADFKLGGTDSYYYGGGTSDYDMPDDYITKDSFSQKSDGRQCFTLSHYVADMSTGVNIQTLNND